MTQRKRLSSSVRFEVWEKYCGKLYEHKCQIPFCSTTMSVRNFHVSHVIALADGGTNSMSNLRPLCPQCNLSMGTMSMSEYSESIAPSGDTPVVIKQKINKYDNKCDNRTVVGVSDPKKVAEILRKVDECIYS